MTSTITNVTNELYEVLTMILQGLSTNAAAIVGLLVLSIVVFLAKDLIAGVFGIFTGVGKIGKRK
jgi:hypothetical protein